MSSEFAYKAQASKSAKIGAMQLVLAELHIGSAILLPAIQCTEFHQRLGAGVLTACVTFTHTVISLRVRKERNNCVCRCVCGQKKI